jgi:hypothetical protein
MKQSGDPYSLPAHFCYVGSDVTQPAAGLGVQFKRLPKGVENFGCLLREDEFRKLGLVSNVVRSRRLRNVEERLKCCPIGGQYVLRHHGRT